MMTKASILKTVQHQDINLPTTALGHAKRVPLPHSITCSCGDFMKRPEATKRQPGRRSAAESRDTRERLLAAAEKHFARYGYSGTSIRDLGSALGIASSSVLYHVGSKRKLYALVLQRISDSLSSVLRH